jgi:N-methylhydantoinase A
MDGVFHMAPIYDRALLLAGNIVEGPAIIVEMDSTTLILADCRGEIDPSGVILIRPRETTTPVPEGVSTLVR